MEKTKMSPPWVTYVVMMRQLFKRDKDVNVQVSEDGLNVKLLVDGADKAAALEKLLPKMVEFGNVQVTISVCPSNKEMTTAELFRAAFDGNALYDETLCIDPLNTGSPMTYVMFKPEVIQFYSDNLGDPNGNTTTLAQDIAREVFDGSVDGAFYCTSQEIFK